jgi:hypothetical protein
MGAGTGLSESLMTAEQRATARAEGGTLHEAASAFGGASHSEASAFGRTTRGVGSGVRRGAAATSEAVRGFATTTKDALTGLLRGSQATTEALETMSSGLKDMKQTNAELKNSVEKLEQLGKSNPEVKDAVEGILTKGRDRGFIRSNATSIAFLGAALAGFAIEAMTISREDCMENCKTLLSPEPTLGYFGGGTECKTGCGTSVGPKVGPRSGYSDQNCCCDPPGSNKLLETTSKKCSSFCNTDCGAVNRRRDAIAGVMDDPATALEAAAAKGLDVIATTATAGVDFATWFAVNLPYIILGMVLLIGLPLIFYLIKGVMSGVKDSGKIVAEAAKGKGSGIVKNQVQKITGVSRRGKKMK